VPAKAAMVVFANMCFLLQSKGEEKTR